MRQLTISQQHMEELVLEALKQDLENVQEGCYCLTADKQAKKDIKALKRVINFYSINPPYADI